MLAQHRLTAAVKVKAVSDTCVLTLIRRPFEASSWRSMANSNRWSIDPMSVRVERLANGSPVVLGSGAYGVVRPLIPLLHLHDGAHA